MNGIPGMTFELLLRCALIALVLERAMSVLFAGAAGGPNRAAKLPAVLCLPGAARFPVLGRLPLRDGLMVACAELACRQLPIRLGASLQPGLLDPELDALLGALFIAGLAQLLHDLARRLDPRTGVAAPSFPRSPVQPTPVLPKTAEAATDAFKLGGLSLSSLKLIKTLSRGQSDQAVKQ